MLPKGRTLTGEKGRQSYGAAYKPVLSQCHGVTVSRCHGVMGQINGSAFLNGDVTGCGTEDGDLETPDLVAGVSK